MRSDIVLNSNASLEPRLPNWILHSRHFMKNSSKMGLTEHHPSAMKIQVMHRLHRRSSIRKIASSKTKSRSWKPYVSSSFHRQRKNTMNMRPRFEARLRKSIWIWSKMRTSTWVTCIYWVTTFWRAFLTPKNCLNSITWQNRPHTMRTCTLPKHIVWSANFKNRWLIWKKPKLFQKADK